MLNALKSRKIAEKSIVLSREDRVDRAETPFDSLSWSQGRRIVELQVLADGLKACSDCGECLPLHNIVEEKRYGFASLLYVQCECGVMNSVYTGKSHHVKDDHRGIPIYDVNTKAATGKNLYTVFVFKGFRQLYEMICTLLLLLTLLYFCC